MKRHKRLTIRHETVRQLTTTALTQAAGGGSQLQTCSMCPPGLYGCHTGNNC